MPSLLELDSTVGLLGDVHGDVDALCRALHALARSGVRDVVQLGNLGLALPGELDRRRLDRVEYTLGVNAQRLFFLDGDEDSIPYLNSLARAEDGSRPLRSRIAYWPPGIRGTFVSGGTFAAFGGASAHIDGYSYCAIDGHGSDATEIGAAATIGSSDDHETLGTDEVDVLFGHVAPLDVLALDEHLNFHRSRRTAAVIGQAVADRARVQAALEQVNPVLYIGAHYHHVVDEVVGFIGATPSATRVVLLNQIAAVDEASIAILEVQSLYLTLHTRAGFQLPDTEQITDLSQANKGLWLVHTAGSQHLIDLQRCTVTRYPIPGTMPLPRDGQPLRIAEFYGASIGDRGIWRVWERESSEARPIIRRTSLIRHIERIDSFRNPTQGSTD